MGKSKVSSWVAKQLLVYGSAFVIFYFIGFGFGIIPQPLKDGLAWTGENFTIIVFLICFSIGAFVVLKFLNYSKGSKQ